MSKLVGAFISMTALTNPSLLNFDRHSKRVRKMLRKFKKKYLGEGGSKKFEIKTRKPGNLKQAV